MIIDSGIVTGSLQVSGSFSVQGATTLQGSLNVTGGITGSLSGSATTEDSASFSTRIADLESWSSSLDLTYATDAQLNASASTLQAGVTASINVLSSSVAPQIASLQAWSSSLDSGYVTNTELNASSSALQAGVTSSINVATQNIQAGVTASIAGFATTGSNTFTGNNVFTDITASNAKFNSASIEYLSVIYQTSSVVYSSGSNQFGDAPGDTQTLYGTIDIKNGPVLVSGSLNASGTIIATTASFGITTASALIASSLYGSGSNQFGNATTDSNTFYGLVDIKNGPVYVTGSMNVGQRITAGELTVLYGITGSLFGTSSYTLEAISASRAVSALNADTASYVLQSISASFAQQAINSFTASYVATAQTASYVFQAQNAFTASYALQAETSFTASYVSLAQTASYVESAQTASLATQAINSFTASYVEIAQTASFVQTAQTALTASFVQQAQTAITASYALITPSASTATQAISAFTASSADSLLVRDFLTVGGPINTTHQLYVTTSISDGTFGLDSSGDINAMYFLKGGVRKFEISTQGDGTPITQLLPYTASSVFRIGNPANASDDFIFVSEPVDGNVLLGPGIVSGSYSLSGSQPTDLVQFTGDTFVSGNLTVLGNQSSQGTITSPTFIGSLQGTANTAIAAPYYVTTASYAIDSASFSTRVTNLESWSSSLDAAFATDAQLNAATGALQAGVTSSINVATFNIQAGVTASLDLATGSLQAGVTSSINVATSNIQAGVTASLDLVTGSLQTGVTSSINVLSSSVAPQIASLQAWSSSLDNVYATNAELNTSSSVLQAGVTSSINVLSSSVAPQIVNLEATASTLTSASASFASDINSIASIYATTGSNTFTGTQNITNTTNATSFTSTAALYTDGGFRATKDAYVSGALYVAGDLTVYGTSSVNYVTTSVFVGLEYINLNTDLPALRYAGINVGDSGSAADISSSFWYDSQNNDWIFVHSHTGGGQTSSLAIFGPIAYDNVGNEVGITGNYLAKGQALDHDHHITSSQIYDDGTTVAIAGNLQVTGSLYALNLTGSLNGSNLVDGTVTNAKLQNSSVTVTAGTGLSGGGSVSLGSSVTLTNAGVTSFNTRTGAVTLASTDIGELGAGIFSGSSQIPNGSITNAQLANSTISGIALGSNLATLTIGTGLSGTSYNGSGAVTIANTGVTSNVAGTGISVSGATGAVTITNTGVTSAVAGTGVSVSSGTGAVTISIGQSVATSASPSFAQVLATTNGTAENFKVGDDAWIGDVNVANTIKVKGVQDATAGYIAFGNQTTQLGLTNSTTLTWGASFTATGDVTAYSDARVKENVKTIENALEKVLALRGVTYTRTDLEDKSEKMGVIAQETREVVPQVVTEENDRLSVAYGNLGGLFIEAFKAQQEEINTLKLEMQELKAKLK